MDTKEGTFTGSVTLSIDKAIEYYNSGDPTLKEIAKGAFCEYLLDQENLVENLMAECPTFRVNMSSMDYTFMRPYLELRLLARHFNTLPEHKPDGEIRYYIGGFPNPIVFSTTLRECIPGVIPFNREEDAERAIKIMGNYINVYLRGFDG